MTKVTAVGLAKADGQMHVQEVIALKELVRDVSANPVIVNIGAGLEGVSALAMLEERPGAFIFSIDTKPRLGELGSLRGAGASWQRVVRLLGRSQDIGECWRFPMDFLFVDGEHKYSAVMRDIRLFVPWIKSGGIAAFHDYVPCPPRKRARRATFAIDEGMAEMVGYEEILHVDRLKAFRRGKEWWD